MDTNPPSWPQSASILARKSSTSSALAIEGKIAFRRKIKRLALTETFKKLPPCVVGMEACLSAHFISRDLRQLGHKPRIIPAKGEMAESSRYWLSTPVARSEIVSGLI
jgi:transposase